MNKGRGKEFVQGGEKKKVYKKYDKAKTKIGKTENNMGEREARD